MLHADDGLLHGYLDGALPAVERARLDAHLRECAECRARLDAERALVARADALLGAVAPPEREIPDYARLRRPRRRHWRLPVAWAASIAAAFATGWYLQEQRDAGHLADNTTQIAGARTDAPEPPAVAHAPRQAAPPAHAPAAPAAAPTMDAKAKAAPVRSLAVTEAPQEERDRLSGSSFDTAAAYALLGRAPATLADRPILSMARLPNEDGGGVVIEQEVGAGAVIRLYERQVPVSRDEAAPMARERASARSGVQPAPAARAQESERLARYVGTLRVEIEGPLPADSLSKLLDLVR